VDELADSSRLAGDQAASRRRLAADGLPEALAPSQFFRIHPAWARWRPAPGVVH
jgi:hypothetical protein